MGGERATRPPDLPRTARRPVTAHIRRGCASKAQVAARLTTTGALEPSKNGRLSTSGALARNLPITSAMSKRRTHRYALVDGVRIHWVDMPSLDPDSRLAPLVLLHGLNDCYRTWRRVAPVAARHRRVLIPDLPGHGLSGRPDAGYELDWYARLMSRWLESLGVQRCDVVGHSFGGGVAQTMLLECPDRIRRLALVASGGLGREVSWLLRLAAIPMVVERFGQPLMGPCTRFALRALGSLLGREDVDRLTSLNERQGSARAFARTVRDVIGLRGQRRSFFERARDLRRLPAIGLFWGDRDPIIPVSHARAMEEYVHGARLTVFESCGHYPHHEHTDAFVAALLHFLDDPTVCRATLRRAEEQGPVSADVRWSLLPDAAGDRDSRPCLAMS
jgi:pimeloyl-ACP methyl ester carboxylesterase